MIDHAHRLIFVHIPRTAGTSIEKALTGADYWFAADGSRNKHATAAQLERDYQPQWPAYFRAAIVRNPYTWILSQFLAETGPLQKNRSHFRAMLRGLRRPALTVAKFYAVDTQADILDAPLDFVGRFENLADDFPELCRRAAIQPPPHLPHSHAQTAGLDLGEWFDGPTLAAVYRKFRRDFDRFGYPAAPPWAAQYQAPGPVDPAAYSPPPVAD